MLRKTIPAQTFGCRNGSQGFTGAGWLGWRSPERNWGIVLWGKLTRLQAGFLAQQLRAFSRQYEERPSHAVIDVLGLELEDLETEHALRMLGKMPDLSPHAARTTLLVSNERAARITREAFCHFGPMERMQSHSNPDDLYPRLGITHESELCEQMKQALNHPPQVDFTKEQLETYVSSNLSKPNIGEACTELNLTRRTLQRRLHEAGTSFQKVVIFTRIKFAKRLLSETRAPITQIAVDVGFATLQAFSSAFRRETGLSPSNYRNAAQAMRDELELTSSSSGRADESQLSREKPSSLAPNAEPARQTITTAPASGTRAVETDLVKIAALG